MPSFVCQRCKQPLRIDDSLVDLDESAADLLLAPLSNEEQAQRQKRSSNNDTRNTTKPSTLLPSTATDTSHVSRKYIHRQPQRPIADSFVMLSASQVHPPSSTSSSPSNARLSPYSHHQLHPSDTLSSATSSGPAKISYLASATTAPTMKKSPSQGSSLSPSTTLLTTKSKTMSSSPNANPQVTLATTSAAAKAIAKADATKSTTAAATTSTTATTTTATTNTSTTITTTTDHHRNNTLSHRLKVATLLFDVMSSKSNVDHPMCQECTDMMLEGLERQLDDVGRERDCYLDFLKKVKEQQQQHYHDDDDDDNDETTTTTTSISTPTTTPAIAHPGDQNRLAAEVDMLKKKEQVALQTLETMQTKRRLLEQQYKDLQEEEKQLEEEEQAFWDECNSYQIEYQQFQNERDAINLKYDHDVRQLERLQKTVVYNDAFCIVQDGPFGKINGYRLGRLASHPVEWNEINAAWGQTLLLLYTVANKLKFQFQSYRLVPMGSFSKVEKVDGDVVVAYELYGSSDYGLNRLFLNRRFDHAMVAMLNCLKQLSDYAEQKDRTIRLPYRINKDKIGELSIRLQFNQDELWTKALRYMLTNMKWILIFASRASIVVDS